MKGADRSTTRQSGLALLIALLFALVVAMVAEGTLRRYRVRLRGAQIAAKRSLRDADESAAFARTAAQIIALFSAGRPVRRSELFRSWEVEVGGVPFEVRVLPTERRSTEPVVVRGDDGRAHVLTVITRWLGDIDVDDLSALVETHAPDASTVAIEAVTRRLLELRDVACDALNWEECLEQLVADPPSGWTTSGLESLVRSLDPVARCGRTFPHAERSTARDRARLGTEAPVLRWGFSGRCRLEFTRVDGGTPRVIRRELTFLERRVIATQRELLRCGKEVVVIDGVVGPETLDVSAVDHRGSESYTDWSPALRDRGPNATRAALRVLTLDGARPRDRVMDLRSREWSVDASGRVGWRSHFADIDDFEPYSDRLFGRIERLGSALFGWSESEFGWIHDVWESDRTTTSTPMPALMDAFPWFDPPGVVCQSATTRQFMSIDRASPQPFEPDLDGRMVDADGHRFIAVATNMGIILHDVQRRASHSVERSGANACALFEERRGMAIRGARGIEIFGIDLLGVKRSHDAAILGDASPSPLVERWSTDPEFLHVFEEQSGEFRVHEFERRGEPQRLDIALSIVPERTGPSFEEFEFYAPLVTTLDARMPGGARIDPSGTMNATGSVHVGNDLQDLTTRGVLSSPARSETLRYEFDIDRSKQIASHGRLAVALCPRRGTEDDPVARAIGHVRLSTPFRCQPTTAWIAAHHPQSPAEHQIRSIQVSGPATRARVFDIEFGRTGDLWNVVVQSRLSGEPWTIACDIEDSDGARVSLSPIEIEDEIRTMNRTDSAPVPAGAWIHLDVIWTHGDAVLSVTSELGPGGSALPSDEEPLEGLAVPSGETMSAVVELGGNVSGAVSGAATRAAFDGLVRDFGLGRADATIAPRSAGESLRLRIDPHPPFRSNVTLRRIRVDGAFDRPPLWIVDSRESAVGTTWWGTAMPRDVAVDASPDAPSGTTVESVMLEWLVSGPVIGATPFRRVSYW